MNKKICPKCKGSGHIVDGMGCIVAMMSIFLIPLIFIENDKDGITRQVCDICDGKGFIKR